VARDWSRRLGLAGSALNVFWRAVMGVAARPSIHPFFFERVIMKKFQKVALVAVATVSAAGAAMADVPAAVTTSITSAGVDGLAIVGGLAAAGASVFLIGKVLRKFGIMI
jgi:hypothetical protein